MFSCWVSLSNSQLYPPLGVGGYQSTRRAKCVGAYQAARRVLLAKREAGILAQAKRRREQHAVEDAAAALEVERAQELGTRN